MILHRALTSIFPWLLQVATFPPTSSGSTKIGRDEHGRPRERETHRALLDEPVHGTQNMHSLLQGINCTEAIWSI